MLRYFVGKKLDREEKRLGESLDYIRYLLKTSFPAFRRFVKIFAIASFRKKLPASAYHLARIVAAREEDCGTCVQIEINLALQCGVSPDFLQAAIRNSPDSLPPDLALAYRFSEAVVKQLPSEVELREAFKERFGEEGLVEIALAIGASRFLPIVKRTLGYGTSCRKVELRALSSTAEAPFT